MQYASVQDLQIKVAGVNSEFMVKLAELKSELVKRISESNLNLNEQYIKQINEFRGAFISSKFTL